MRGQPPFSQPLSRLYLTPLVTLIVAIPTLLGLVSNSTPSFNPVMELATSGKLEKGESQKDFQSGLGRI